MNWFNKLIGKKEEGLKPGDWVNSYSKGIYRIERFVDEYFDESDSGIPKENKIGDSYPQRTVVLKRFLNSKFQKSISYESCSEYFISPLTAAQNETLTAVIKENPSYIETLDNYKIPQIVSIYNMPLQIDNTADLKKIEALMTYIKQGRSFLEIKQEMQKNDLLRLKPESYGNYLFQLFNHDFEYHNKRKVWRDARLQSNKEINEK
jgi:hypothetical protein